MRNQKVTALSKSNRAELDKLAKNIRELHPEVKRYFSNFTFARFAIGCWLLRARAILPDGRRGPGAPADDDGLTFVKWKRQEFPDLPNSTLYDYQSYASRVLETYPELADFDPAKSVTEKKREELLAQLKSCINGKDVTLCLRAMGEIPDATPPGGDRGGRRPKKDIVQEHAIEQQRATEFWVQMCNEIDREASLASWKLVDAPLRDRIIRTLALGAEIKEWSNQ